MEIGNGYVIYRIKQSQGYLITVVMHSPVVTSLLNVSLIEIKTKNGLPHTKKIVASHDCHYRGEMGSNGEWILT